LNIEQSYDCLRTFKDTGKYSRTKKCFSSINDTTSFDSKLKKARGAQGHVATLLLLATPYKARQTSLKSK